MVALVHTVDLTFWNKGGCDVSPKSISAFNGDMSDSMAVSSATDRQRGVIDTSLV